MYEIMENKELENIAKKIRINIVEQVYNAASGHPGGSLSIADIMAVLYFDELKIDKENPNWEERDRLVLSKGHCAPALYGALAERGFFKKDELKKLRKIDSFLQGHPNMNDVPRSRYEFWFIRARFISCEWYGNFWENG